MSDNIEAENQDLEPDAVEHTSADVARPAQERLRKLLANLELTPEQTRDDMVAPSSRDQEILSDVPPHHG